MALTCVCLLRRNVPRFLAGPRYLQRWIERGADSSAEPRARALHIPRWRKRCAGSLSEAPGAEVCCARALGSGHRTDIGAAVLLVGDPVRDDFDADMYSRHDKQYKNTIISFFSKIMVSSP